MEMRRQVAELILVGFPGHEVPGDTRTLIEDGVRSFILFSRNVRDRGQVERLTAELRALAGEDAVVAIDHEGGPVNRLAGVASSWPSPMAWAATGDIALGRSAARCMAAELRALGINLNFAPVADLLADYRNPILGTRCFSDAPQTAAQWVAAFAEGYVDAGVGATAKHFPGHGDTPVDSHADLPEVRRSRETLIENDVVPFAAAVRAGVDCLMTSHVWYSTLDATPTPATLSSAVTGLARGHLGFDGVIVTDCMEMGAIQEHFGTGEAAVRAVEAGADLVIVSHEIERQRDALDALQAAAESGRLSSERLAEARARMERLRQRLAHRPTGWPDGGEDRAREIAARAITVVRDDSGYLPLWSEPGTPIGVVAFDHEGTIVEGPGRHTPRLVERARGRFPAVVEMTARGDEDGHDLAARFDNVETVLVATAFATRRPEQAEVVRALLRLNKRVIALALRDPFDLLAYPEAPCFVVAYDSSDLALDAALTVIAGDAPATGCLPVRLPPM